MKNIGSILAIYYALAADIVSISSPDENGAVEITFDSGKSFTQFVFTGETASFTEDDQDHDAGPFFAQGLTFRVPGISAGQHAVLKSLRDQEFILAVTDGNGKTIIMGTLETPARFSMKMLRPAGTSGYNGYEVSFRCNCTDAAPFLDESFVLS